MEVFSWDDILDAYLGIKSQSTEKILSYFSNYTALTVGKFDGCHLGHQKIYKSVLDYCELKNNSDDICKGKLDTAKKNDSVKDSKKYLSGVVSIYMGNYPKFLENGGKILTTMNQRLESFKNFGFDFCIVIDFSSKFSKIKGTSFLDILRKICSMQFLATGSDFRCGYNLDCGVAELAQYCKNNGLEFLVCPDVCVEGQRVSSSNIKKAVLDGNLKQAELLLGGPYEIDASIFSWQIDSLDSVLIISANITGVLLMPPSKVYEGQIVCNDVKIPVLQSLLHVESNFLRLEIPLEQISTSIKLTDITQFILGIKIKRSK